MLSKLTTPTPFGEETANPGGDTRPIREVAAILGVGRSRIFNLEHGSLMKIRTACLREGIVNAEDFQSASPQHGWLTVSCVLSLNGGSVSVEDIVRAFQLLKQSHSKIVRPPVLISDSKGTRISYRIETVANFEGAMRIRCWPVRKKTARRSVAKFFGVRCTAIVDSVFDSDREGPFNVPILVAAIVSASRTPPKS